MNKHPRWNRSAPAIVAMVATILLGACEGGFTNVTPTPAAGYQRLGAATGSACGSLGILSTALNFVPMGVNGRVERAYADAVASVPGATALVDVTVQEDWYWWLVGTARCVTVTGEAVK